MNKRLALITAAGLSSVRSVKDVVNDLTIHESANNIRSLQRSGRRQD